jgi:transposase
LLGAEALVVSETIEGAVVQQVGKRQRRSQQEKRRIVEATLMPGASIARIAREYGVNANQVFQWRYEYRKQTSGTRDEAKTGLLPVALAAETCMPSKAEVLSPAPPSRSIHIELPGRAVISVESGVDVALVQAVIESLRR